MTGDCAPFPAPILEVATLRRAMADAGFPPVALRTSGKEPTEKGWPQKARATRGSADVGLPSVDALNTGLALHGLRVVDIDVDDPRNAEQVDALAEQMLGPTVSRTRPVSPRKARLYRAAEGEPGKRSAEGAAHDPKGASCKVEILGNGQQLHAYGLHPSGVEPVWSKRPGLDIVRDELPAVTEAQIDQFLTAVAPLIGAPPPGSTTAVSGTTSSIRGSTSALAGQSTPAAFQSQANLPDMNAAASARPPPSWFDALPVAEKLAAIVACLIVLNNTQHDPRERWMQVGFACCAAEAAGAAGALDAFRNWSRGGASFQNDADVEALIASYKGGAGSIGVGTLLKMGINGGANLSQWLNPLVAANATASATTTAVNASLAPHPLSAMPHEMDQPTALSEINNRFFFAAEWGGGPTFGTIGPDGVARPLKWEELGASLSNKFVRVPDGDRIKLMGAARWWRIQPHRRSYDLVCYDPEGNWAPANATVLNLWRGFAIQPVRGCWHRMRTHLRTVICGGNTRAYNYLKKWLAHAVQHPGANPEIMIVIRSDLEGVGKSTVGQWFLRIFGVHGHEATGIKEIFGEFNEVTANKSFILLEEPVFPGDHQMAEALRAIITAHTRFINPKGRQGYTVPHTIHFLMTTNGKWAIPAGADARRFLMLDVRDKMPRPYFDALWAEAEGGGIAAMLHELQSMDLRGFNIRDVPTTAALVQQQRYSADDITQWAQECALNGVLVQNSPNGGFGQRLASQVLHQGYLAWASAQGIRRPKSGVPFGRALGEMGLARGASNNPPTWNVPDRAAFLAAVDRRAGIRKVQGR